MTGRTRTRHPKIQMSTFSSQSPRRIVSGALSATGVISSTSCAFASWASLGTQFNSRRIKYRVQLTTPKVGDDVHSLHCLLDRRRQGQRLRHSGTYRRAFRAPRRFWRIEPGWVLRQDALVVLLKSAVLRRRRGEHDVVGLEVRVDDPARVEMCEALEGVVQDTLDEREGERLHCRLLIVLTVTFLLPLSVFLVVFGAPREEVLLQVAHIPAEDLRDEALVHPITRYLSRVLEVREGGHAVGRGGGRHELERGVLEAQAFAQEPRLVTRERFDRHVFLVAVQIVAPFEVRTRLFMGYPY